MKDIEKIVVPIDLDRHTSKLVEFAVYFAGKLSASLHLIHVIENPHTGDSMLGSPSFEPLLEEQVEKARVFVGNYVEDFSETWPNIAGSVRRGEVVEEIVSCAAEENADLVIIGTHGTKGLEKILLGSVAERVVQRAHCPTLTMNPYR